MNNKLFSWIMGAILLLLFSVNFYLFSKSSKLEGEFDKKTEKLMKDLTKLDFPITKIYKFREDNPLPSEEHLRFYKGLNRYTASKLYLLQKDGGEKEEKELAGKWIQEFQPELEKMIYK